MRSRRYLDLLVYLAALVSTVAWARGIECAATRPSVGRVVCDRAFPSNQCDDIVAQPQALLGAAEPFARLAQSRQPRSACADIRWINTAFGQGEINSQAVGLNTAAAPAADMASIPEPAPDAAASSAAAAMPDGDSLSASATSPPSGVSQAHQSSEAGARLPQPAASNAVSTRATSSMNESSRGMGLTGLLTALIIIAIVLSAFIIRRNKALGITTDYRRAGGKKRR